MPSLISSLVRFRRDPRLLKLPPYLSLLCILVGVASLLVLPLNSYSRRTYISENALLPGQVHTYFGGSDQHVFRAYKHEVNALLGQSNTAINDHLEPILASVGLKVGRQNYTYRSAGETFEGENLYAILQAPRGDATEALVLVAPWRSIHDVPNPHGVALSLALARYFRRWSLWSKDIIFLFPPDSLTGPQAWVDAYHDAHDGRYVSPLPRKSGALQGAIAIDYTKADEADNDGNGSSRFTAVHIVYDGVNGQLPNLDLINSVVNIAGGQMGTGVSLQDMWRHNDGYADRLRTMLRGMLRQGLGAATGAHSAFMAYHVDAITLQPYTATALNTDGNVVISGWQHDEMAMGRILEGTFRSLNNLLEHLHQSFFFYLLMSRERFVSIGTYLPSAMLLAANFTIMAIALWVRSGQAAPKPAETASVANEKKGKAAEPPAPAPSGAEERDLFLPLAVVALCQALGVVPLYLFNHVPAWLMTPVFIVFALVNSALPHVIARVLNNYYRVSAQQYDLIKSFSLLLLGMFLSSLATLNFSLAFLVGLLASPLTFMQPAPRSKAQSWLATMLLNHISPPAVLVVCCMVWQLDLGEALRLAAFGWDVWGMYTAVVLWCVWWPAWLVSSVLVLGRPAPVAAKAAPKAK
ncbi:Glycosyl phosphatidyl inositol protein transamidase complex subunit [Sporothrix eucalyptigena]|uniref:Glycosyl phosphatidyl inositol protein transamidase complex subunit n=1 Tax=Sporothrix eucalyptigena TaxID=1812306 RepID=A0ABP0BPF5_9PEZI